MTYIPTRPQLLVSHQLAQAFNHRWASVPVSDLHGLDLTDIHRLVEGLHRGRAYILPGDRIDGPLQDLDETGLLEQQDTTGVYWQVSKNGQVHLKVFRPATAADFRSWMDDVENGVLLREELLEQVQLGRMVLEVVMTFPGSTPDAFTPFPVQFTPGFGSEVGSGTQPEHLLLLERAVAALAPLYGREGEDTLADVRSYAPDAERERQAVVHQKRTEYAAWEAQEAQRERALAQPLTAEFSRDAHLLTFGNGEVVTVHPEGTTPWVITLTGEPYSLSRPLIGREVEAARLLVD